MKEYKNIDKNKTLRIADKISWKNDEANNLLSRFKKINKTLENADLVCTKTDGTNYDFNRLSLLLKFIERIHNDEISLDEAINNQTELKLLIYKLNKYNPKNPKKIKEKNNVLKSARKLLDMRKDIIDLFEKGAFLYRGNVFKTTEEQEEKQKETITDIDEFSKYIAEKETDINEELFKRYFGFQKPSDIFNSLIDKNINEELFKRYFGFQKPSDIFNSLTDANDREKNNKLADSIIGVLKNLKKEINEMSEKERKIEKPDKIVEIVRDILKFNKQ